MVFETGFGKEKILKQNNSVNNFESLIDKINNEIRLNSVLNDSRIVCLTFCLLNEIDIINTNIEVQLLDELFQNEIIAQLNNYNSIYKTHNFRYSIVTRTNDLDILIVHLEKIKRDIDSKVFLEDSKHINFNIGIVVYKVDLNNFDSEIFKKELEKMIFICTNEDGTSIIVS